jgi:hypothetical protein
VRDLSADMEPISARWRWGLLLGAAVVIVVRAPVYFWSPNFWAEEGMLHFATACGAPPLAALTFRPVGYLNLWVDLSTTSAAILVRAGVLPLTHAPLVTVMFAFAAQLLPVAVIAWSNAPFWGSALRRIVGIAAVLFGAMTNEIWLSSLNSQHWLALVVALLLLEPPNVTRARARATIVILTIAGLSSPAATALLPLFAWRAWRARARPATEQAVVLAACGLVQASCLLSAIGHGQALPERTKGLDLGMFAATVWLRTLVVPTLGAGAAQRCATLLLHARGPGMVSGLVLIALAVALLTWLARGQPPGQRLYLVGAYASLTTLSLLTAIGDKAMMLYMPAASSRYVYSPGVLVMLILLGCVRPLAGRVRPLVCAVSLAWGLAHGLANYPSSLRWNHSWPDWADQVRAWELDQRRPLLIWPPPWSMKLPARPECSR